MICSIQGEKFVKCGWFSTELFSYKSSLTDGRFLWLSFCVVNEVLSCYLIFLADLSARVVTLNSPISISNLW